jgi:small subunit ribosomal protein S20
VGGRVLGHASLSRSTFTPQDRQDSHVANIKSQIKRIRQNEAARERNKPVRTALKSAVRRFHEAADAGNADEAKALAAEVGKKLDKAASKGVIHKNQAANRKSAIAKRAASL